MDEYKLMAGQQAEFHAPAPWEALARGLVVEVAALQAWKAEALAFYEEPDDGLTVVERRVLRAMWQENP